jgi:hypothetical protein
MTNSDFFFHLETSLHKKEIRNSREKVSELLADDFIEFGKSGGTYSKQDTLESLENETEDLHIAVCNFRAVELSPTVILVTYTTEMHVNDTSRVSTNRSSIWILRENKWQMIFHQGTRKVS